MALRQMLNKFRCKIVFIVMIWSISVIAILPRSKWKCNFHDARSYAVIENVYSKYMINSGEM